MNKLYNILFVARDDGGCSYFRIRQPADFLKRAGLANVKVVDNNASREDLMSSDLIIFQELGSINGSNMAKFCADNKIPYVVEIDDFLHHVSPHNTAGYPAWNPSTLYIYRAMEMARGAMAMTVSTPQLAREYFPYNPSIYVVPNYLNKEKWENPIVKKQDNKIRIGWMGGNAHADDLKMISGVLNKIIKGSKGRVIFETIGMIASELKGVFPMTATPADPCPSCSFEGGLHHFLGASLDEYPLALASKGWDIAVAPVINNSFGNCKSDLKIKEYAATGIPIIASSITPYLEAAESNAQVLFASSFDGWYNSINDLIKHPKKRDQIARANKEWITNYWIQDNVFKIFEVYSQIIAKAKIVFGKK